MSLDGDEVVVIHPETGATGPAGPAGPAGPTGSTGPTGPAGAWVQLTQAAYNVLAPPVAGTLYVIVG